MKMRLLLFILSIGYTCLCLPPKKAIGTTSNDTKIIVYGSDSCHYCLDTKAFLKRNKVNFTYFDVDVNITMQREMLVKMQKAGLSVDNLSLPVVDLQGKLIMNNVEDFEGFLNQLITKNK